MRRSWAWVLPILAAVIVALGNVLPAPSQKARPAASVTVGESAYACPLNRDNTVLSGRFAAHPDARATAVELPGERSNRVHAGTAGWNESTVDARVLLVNTKDPAGAGAVGFTGSVGAKGDGGGLEVQACPGVVQDAWYLGAGSGSRHFSTLTLTNVSAAPAVADLQLWGRQGSVEAIGADAIVLKAFGSRRIRLDSIAAGEAELALRVTSRRGALSVSVRDTATGVLGGTDPIAPTSAPARKQLIAGIAAEAGMRQLLLLNPGVNTARVTVETLAKGGALVPKGLEDIKVPAGRLTVVEVPRSAVKGAQAWRVTADQPLSASVRMAPSNKDFSYAVSGPTLSGPALAPLRLGTLVDGVRLLVTAPAGNATVTVRAFDERMRARGQTSVPIPAGFTTSLNLAKKGLFARPLDELSHVVLTAQGPVAGAMVYTSGAGLSAVPLRPAPLRAPAPSVRPAR